MVKIALFIPDLAGGGAQRQCALLFNALNEVPECSEAHLLVLRAGTVYDSILNERFADRIHVIRASSYYDPRAVSGVRANLRRLDIDVLLTWQQASDVFGWAATRGTGIRWFIAERDSRYPARDWRFVLRQHLGRYADGILANSDAGLDYWRTSHPGRMWLPSRRQVRARVPNIVSLPELTSPTVEISRRRTILSVGRLENQKRPLEVAKAFNALAEVIGHDFRFAIAGQGSLKSDLEALMSSLPSGRRIELLGYVPNVDTVISQARLFLTLSQHEGMPNTVLEAVASRVPVVATDIPEHRAILGENYPFFVRPCAPTAEVVTCLERALLEWLPEDFNEALAIVERMTGSAVAQAYMTAFSS